MHLRVVTPYDLISHENANIRKVYFIIAWYIYFFRTQITIVRGTLPAEHARNTVRAQCGTYASLFVAVTYVGGICLALCNRHLFILVYMKYYWYKTFLIIKMLICVNNSNNIVFILFIYFIYLFYLFNINKIINVNNYMQK